MKDDAVAASRGVVYIAFAKLYFMVAGYAIYFTLPRLLGESAAWGNYLIVVGLVSVIDNVIVTSTIQGVSKFTARGDASADAIKRAAIRIQSLLGGGVALVYFLLAPAIAGWERDPSLSGMYRISAGIVLCYSFYAIFVGSLNGQRHFGRQAMLDVLFATIRALAILGCAALGLGAAGAIGGFVGAAAAILLVAAIWVGLPRAAEPFDSGQLWRFMAQLFVYTFALNLMMRTDLFLLKRIAATMVDGSADYRATFASTTASFYGTAQSLAFIPYQGILALAFVIFPLISRATFEQDIAATRAYIEQTLRLTLVLVGGIAVVFIANPESVIGVPYPEQYRVGGPALRILASGMICFSMFTIINTILNGAGRTRVTIGLGLFTLGVAIAANWLLIPRATNQETALVFAASATSGAFALGLSVGSVALKRTFNATLPTMSLVRVVVAGALATGVGIAIPEVSRIVTLLECSAVLLAYGAALALMGEIGRKELSILLRVVGRRT